jgi:ABC-type Fe3+-hydroxamate transport system substrate-binding protein
VRYPKISLEEVLRGQPDVILDFSQSSSDLSPWQQVDVPAVRDHRVHAIAPFASRPTPRIEEALGLLETALR